MDIFRPVKAAVVLLAFLNPGQAWSLFGTRAAPTETGDCPAELEQRARLRELLSKTLAECKQPAAPENTPFSMNCLSLDEQLKTTADKIEAVRTTCEKTWKAEREREIQDLKENL